MISKDDVRYIAALARIHLEDQDLDHFTEDLEKILHHIDKLKQLDVKGVEPTTHVLHLKNVYRNDVPHEPLPQKEALKTAVAQEKGSFKVPQVIE